MIESQNKVRLGELLVDSEVVSSSDLTEAIQVSTRLNTPIGRVLLLSGLVSPVTLEAALEAQPLLNEEKQTKEEILKALKQVDSTGKPLEKLLPGAYNVQHSQVKGDKLAGLLLDSEIVSQDQLDQALSTSFEAGVPLGSALVMEGILSPSLFPSILKIQKDVRDNAITKDEAIEQVKSTFMHWLKAEESFSTSGKSLAQKPVEQKQEEKPKSESPSKPETPISITFEPEPKNDCELRLIDLLIELDILSKKSIQNAFDKALDNPEQSARLLEALGLINEDTKNKAARCHSMFLEGELSREEAKYVLDESFEFKDEEITPPKPAGNSLVPKVVGGMAAGAFLAGLSILIKKPK